MCVHHRQGSMEEFRASPSSPSCKEKEPKAQKVTITDLCRVIWQVLRRAEAKTQIPYTLANCLCNLTSASEGGSLRLIRDLQIPNNPSLTRQYPTATYIWIKEIPCCLSQTTVHSHTDHQPTGSSFHSLTRFYSLRSSALGRIVIKTKMSASQCVLETSYIYDKYLMEDIYLDKYDLRWKSLCVYSCVCTCTSVCVCTCAYESLHVCVLLRIKLRAHWFMLFFIPECSFFSCSPHNIELPFQPPISTASLVKPPIAYKVVPPAF